MNRRLLAVAALVVCSLLWGGKLTLSQGDWPDLTVLQDYPKTNQSCGPEGNALPGTEKAKSNALKNRFKLPEGGWSSFQPITIKQMLELPPFSGQPAPASDHEGNAKAVQIVGYVQSVSPGGTRGESCNCKAKSKKLCDAHIDLVLDPNRPDPDGHYKIVVEVTERGRRLAKRGLLKSNIGTDWSTTKLRSRLQGRWVRFYGWRFYDPDHHSGSWKFDPQDEMGEDNWRGTAWEVHPVMGIERLEAAPPEIREHLLRNRERHSR